jgi:hypothetical protein
MTSIGDRVAVRRAAQQRLALEALRQAQGAVERCADPLPNLDEYHDHLTAAVEALDRAQRVVRRKGPG